MAVYFADFKQKRLLVTDTNDRASALRDEIARFDADINRIYSLYELRFEEAKALVNNVGHLERARAHALNELNRLMGA